MKGVGGEKDRGKKEKRKKGGMRERSGRQRREGREGEKEGKEELLVILSTTNTCI